MNEIQAIFTNSARREAEALRKAAEKVRQISGYINQYYRDYPYCPECKCRAPRNHRYHIYAVKFDEGPG